MTSLSASMITILTGNRHATASRSAL